MKNTYEIIAFSETCGDKFFTIAITNKEGETHTDIFSEITLMKFSQKGAAFTVDLENADLVHELCQLGFIEIALEQDGETGAALYDVYFHKFFIDGNEDLSYDAAGTYLKTYKTEKGALNYAAKQGYPVFY
jgi:hypothetical protein